MKTILSVKDFSILYNLVNYEIIKAEQNAIYYSFGKKETQKQKEKRHKLELEELKNDKRYQDLYNLKEKLGNLSIEIETPDVEIKE